MRSMLPRASAENFPGKRGERKKDQKLAKIPKNSTIYPLSGGRQRKKDRKIAKKGQKIALLSLYLLYLHHI